MTTPKPSFFRVGYLDNRTTLIGLRDKLNNLIDGGYTDIYFKYDQFDGDIALYAQRMESLEEAKERELQNKKFNDMMERSRAERKTQLIEQLDRLNGETSN